jgi:hypothetical protein
MKNEIMIIDDKTIEDKIYVVRGKQVMIDSDLAAIYGYETKDFNRQVRNNIERFDDDFMFQLTDDEVNELSRCKKFTTMQTKGIKGGRVYNPYVFTEQGVYMLMTVLRGELAIKQSKALIRVFKKMKDYIIETNKLTGYNNVIDLALQTKENTDDIKIIKKELNTIHKFLDIGYDKEIIILNGQQVEANLAYKRIYSLAKESIYIVDDYISLKTLVLLKDIDKNVKITIFSDNVGKKLHAIEYNDFVNEYDYLNISFKSTNNKFHDRYIIIDYGKRNEKIFHCGSSSKDSGKKITTIMEINDKKLYIEPIDDLFKNDELILT